MKNYDKKIFKNLDSKKNLYKRYKEFLRKNKDLVHLGTLASKSEDMGSRRKPSHKIASLLQK
jgi:hypothetical protein